MEKEIKKDLLRTPCRLKQFTFKNRICVPPLVVWNWSDETGKVAQEEIDHYKRLVNGGAGLVFQEATSVCPEGRLANSQLGIWDNSQIDGLKHIVKILHDAGMPAIIQLSYAGLIAANDQDRVSPSPFSYIKNGVTYTGRELTISEIHTIEQQFIQAAKRAVTAGYDGVELHCCHGYLLGAFLNRALNTRTDEYNANDRLILRNIIQGIRENTPPDFLLGCRIGSYEPELEDGLTTAKWLETQGIDFIDAYLGCPWVEKGDKPSDFPFRKSIYGAYRIKQEVSLPVIAIHGIASGEEAEQILEMTGVDMVAIGRASLMNPNWANDVLNNQDPGKCLECKQCVWLTANHNCPGRILRKHSSN